MSLRLVEPVPERTCSFCGKDESEAEGMVAGPQVYVCYGCVDVAAELVRAARGTAPAQASIAPAVKWDMPAKTAAVLANPLFAAQDGRCFYCDGEMNPARKRVNKRPNSATRDHFIPRSKRLWAQGACNTVWAHFSCNSAKGSRMPTPEEARRFLALMEKLGMPPHPKAIEIAGEA